MDATSYGQCVTREMTGSAPDADDIMVVAKHRMADAEPHAVVALVSAQKAADLRASMQQPQGVAPHREISVKVQQNIASVLPKCVRQGIVSRDAEAYLTNWSQATWVPLPRPSSYPLLDVRRAAEEFPGNNFVGSRIPWAKPPRLKHVDLKVPGADSDGETSGDEDGAGAVVLAD